MKKCIAVLAVLLLSLSLPACSGSAGSSKFTPARSGSKLARVKDGMSDNDVRRILGNPSQTRPYMTGKGWIPFYYGPDTHRTDWIYNKVGRVVFSRNRWSGGLKVIAVSSEPNIK
jgi:outer membrane protein assembly factor BamE (lipoprotein component of BamABCDE complex)